MSEPGNTGALSRRGFCAAALAATGACSRRQPSRDGKIHLRFSVWGEPVEMAAFRSLIGRYERVRPRTVIELEQIGYRTRDEIDTLLAAGVGPDLFRVEYLDVGRYSPSGALIDLTKYLPPQLGAEFTTPVWTAVEYRGGIHALPHHTDTSAVLYNKTLFSKLGIRIPRTIDESWSWREFVDIARLTKRHGYDYGFAVNWTLGGAFRWLNFLFQRGGCLLTDRYRDPAIPSQEALETLEWTQSFFREALVPSSDSAKSSEQVENLFANSVVPMYFDVGPQSLRELKTNFEWAATYLPQDRARASELGGTAIGVSRDCPFPAEAADFALFATNQANMREFVEAAQFLPVRRQLLAEKLNYRYRPDEMQIHLEQSKTVPLALARTVTLPNFHRIAVALADQLDLAFTGGQSAEATLENIAQAIARTRGPGI